jgi:hypothetical protein
MFRRIFCLHLQGQTDLDPQLLFSSRRSDEPPMYIIHKLTSHTYLDSEDGGRIFFQHISTAAHCRVPKPKNRINRLNINMEVM